MNIKEARLYLEHTSKDDFNLEEWQKENRYQAIQVVLKEIERLNNIINEVREILNTQLAFTSSYQLNYQSAMSIIEEAKSTLRGVDKN